MNSSVWETQLGDFDAGDSAPAQLRSPLLDATVMMVDDEPLMTELIQAHLEDEGYSNFVSTNDPHQTMALLARNEPGVVLLDLMMPGLSGFDLLELIRGQRAFRYIPVIVLTAATGSETKLRALQLGATDFLSKPVDASELVLRVRNALAFRQYHTRMVNFDVATGLPNQRLFERSLGAVLDNARLPAGSVALLNVTVPDCREVRETFGQTAADRLAKTLAERLSRISELHAAGLPSEMRLDRGPSVARLSGEAFAILLEGMASAESVEAVAKQIVSELSAAVPHGDHEVVPTPCIGIAVAPNDGETAEALLTAAEIARTQAQQRGGAGYMFFSAELSARSLERLTLGSQLRHAVARGELRLHYQPKVDIRTGRINGAEALLRWQHPEHGLVQPGRFISLAEELGLIGEIGNWVIGRACHDASRWLRQGLGEIKIAVNVAQPQFVDGLLCTVLRKALAASGLPARLLVVELTESMLMGDAAAALATIHEMKEIGISLSIDDFGTGYSSLSYLKRLPVDELKIDRSFVMDLPGGPADVAIVRTIVSLGHNLGMRVVAEGVETDEQLQTLRMLDCDTFQGFLFSRPLAEDRFCAFLREHTEAAVQNTVPSPFVA